jgi:hypothetical protein
MLNKINRALIDERSHYGFAIKRISDWQTLVSGEQSIANFRCDRLVHDYAPGGRATLPSGAHGAEKD